MIAVRNCALMLSLALAMAQLLTPAVCAAELRGVVVAVADGDSLTLRDGSGERHRVRVGEIDAPEQGQPYSRAARQRLLDLCLRQHAVVSTSRSDSYDRVVGSVRCDGVDAGSELVRWGLAWVYERYASADSPLHELQQEAQTLRRGLWSDRAPVAPWQHRNAQRRGFSATPGQGAAALTAAGPVRGNRNSKIYHLPHCPSFDAVSLRNRVGFATETEARSQGYRRARNCH